VALLVKAGALIGACHSLDYSVMNAPWREAGCRTREDAFRALAKAISAYLKKNYGG
jgi:hypothetical protein